MRKMLVTVAAIAALAGFSAYAQDSTTSGGAAGTTNAQDAKEMMWEGPVAETFYSDVAARTMRPESEWSTGWAALTDEQRAKVKADCTANTAQPRDEGVTRACVWAGNQ